MVDFDKLNAMIDEVHTVIKDVEVETKDAEAKVYDIKKDRYDKVVADLVKYCDVLTKARNGSQIRVDIEIPTEMNGGKFLFTRVDQYHESWPDYGLKVSNGEADFYSIIDSKYGDKTYCNINHSHPSIIWFENLIKEWDDVKDIVEEDIVNGVNIILKQQSEIAHKKYENAKSKLNTEF